jgi:hypothetical protein
MKRHEMHHFCLMANHTNGSWHDLRSAKNYLVGGFFNKGAKNLREDPTVCGITSVERFIGGNTFAASKIGVCAKHTMHESMMLKCMLTQPLVQKPGFCVVRSCHQDRE